MASLSSDVIIADDDELSKTLKLEEMKAAAELQSTEIVSNTPPV